MENDGYRLVERIPFGKVKRHVQMWRRDFGFFAFGSWPEQILMSKDKKGDTSARTLNESGSRVSHLQMAITAVTASMFSPISWGAK